MDNDKQQEGFAIDAEIAVLLVDDNKVNQFLGKKILRNLGLLNVEVASDGFTALEMMKCKNYNVLLTDVEMPGMNGYELTSLVRKSDNNSITTIALTANASETERDFALKNGMNDYIAKPYSPADLLKVLRKHVLSRNNFILGDAASEPLVFLNPILSLYSLFNGNRKDVKNLLLLLHHHLPESMQMLKNAILDEEWETTYHTAHKLKSTLKLFNSDSLFSLISNITEYAREDCKRSVIPEMFDELNTRLEGLMVLINNELEAL